MSPINFAYLAALAVSITGMVLLDRRFGLFFWRDARRAAIVLPLGVAFFLIWDLGGILLGIFFRGQTEFMTGLLIGPELPIEEVFFLTLLCYNTMNAYTAAVDWLDGRWSRRASATSIDEGAAG
ncbi:lycopene cyclase domain-containing protein [Microcella humidisoli]|jgi:lycopene cyclase domain-containing protein|uniref:Lycopene cyclase domain-containing protein n=1 Tax=Microcella humidisoli TaxID=2963406 RepID=A0ABY5FZ79_9MICO|nr:lycopene cyclase domain-containing protein [Microcella humidisoli]UTT63442.1 lycopene cyclase domain-containing protein [Microcella humidisoli]